MEVRLARPAGRLGGSSDGVGDDGRAGERSPRPIERDTPARMFDLLDQARLAQAYRLAALILRDPAEAEDATHEAVERAWKAWPSLRDPARFEAWFDRIVANVCKNRLRHSRKVTFVPIDPGTAGTADAHESALTRLAIDAAFRTLTADQRVLLALRYWRDLSVEEIAERLDVPAGTVKSRLHYAIAALRLAMDAREDRR